MDKDIFSLVSRDQDRKRLWQDLALARAEILCKGKSDNLCYLIPLLFTPSEKLECQFKESDNRLAANEEFLGYFFIGGEKYYFKGEASLQNEKIYLSVPKELWRLQRRQNYRVKIPSNYQGAYNITQVNQRPEKIQGQLADLSSQGCRVIYHLKNPLMKVGDTVMGDLIVENKAAIPIQGIVRHIKIDSSDKVVQTFGIEFVPLDPITENKIFAMTMEIHKKHFRNT